MPLDEILLDIALALVAALAGGVASIAGFGIGSILTPLIALSAGTKAAVAVVSIPHALATALRFYLLRQHFDRDILIRFGIFSAIGGLTGAALHASSTSQTLSHVFGALLIFAGLSHLRGKPVPISRGVAWLAGVVSGLFGGLVGNQGGIRSAALLSLRTNKPGAQIHNQSMDKTTFVATATGIGLFVDAVRVPVYLVTDGPAMAALLPTIAIASLGCLIGTVWGARLLRHIPDQIFRQLVGLLIVALGVYMLLTA